MRIVSIAGALVTYTLAAAPSAAAPLTDGELRAALAELEVLKERQAETDARIRAIESKLLGIAPTGEPNEGADVGEYGEAAIVLIPSTPALTVSSRASAAGLNLTGDMLFRFEGNYTDSGLSPDRQRAVMRARLGATQSVNETLTVGGLLETGDPDDPNSGYLTLSNFADDFQVSLSRAYASYDLGGTTLLAGKFAKPFMSTDLLWDGDVNPTGLAGRSKVRLSSGSDINLSGLLFVVDESAGGDDSQMIGAQAHLQSSWGSHFKTDIAAAYYDYELSSVGGADAGDFRTNLLRPDGTYVSDYDLLDLLARLSWTGISERWPVALTVNHVTNLGAAVDDDKALGIDLSVGRAHQRHEFSFAYGYGEAEVDAVLAAFSHDNYSFATNYMAHELSARYVLTENVSLSASLYHYKPLSSAYAGTLVPDEWLDRVRMNLAISY